MCLFVIYVITRFYFEDGNSVMILPNPGHCLLATFRNARIDIFRTGIQDGPSIIKLLHQSAAIDLLQSGHQPIADALLKELLTL